MIEVICSGFGGQGVLVAGMILADAGMEDNKQVSWYPSYGFEMRGGAANCDVKISDEEIPSPFCLEPDIVYTLNETAIDTYESRLKPGGVLLVNSSLVPDERTYRDDIQVIKVPATTIADELGKDYVRTAISRGNDRSGVLRRHVLKNSLVPVVTFLAQTMAEIVAGSIVVEQAFAIPGLGRMLVASIGRRDYPVVQAIIVILAFWVVLAGTVADLINQRIDPRLRLGGGAS